MSKINKNQVKLLLSVFIVFWIIILGGIIISNFKIPIWDCDPGVIIPDILDIKG